MIKLYEPGEAVPPEAKCSRFIAVVIQSVTNKIPIKKSPYGVVTYLTID
jgi:hypothetical protein